MAVFNIFNPSGFTPISFFPDAGVSIGNVLDTQKTYFLASGLQVVVWGTAMEAGTGAIQRVELIAADGVTLLAEIMDITGVSLSEFEAAWLTETTTPNDVFSLLIKSGSVIVAGDGDDRMVGGLGNDVFYGNADGFNTFDYVDYSGDPARTSGVVVDLAAGNSGDSMGIAYSKGGKIIELDKLYSVTGAYGTHHADTLIGDGWDNEFFAGLGNDDILGGGGFDVLSYNFDIGRTGGIVVQFTSEQKGVVVGENGEQDAFDGMEAIYGTAFNDSFTGNHGFQRFRGFGGNDTFDGGEGDDEVDYRRDSPVNGQGITIDLSAAQPDGSVLVQGANGDTDTLIGIEWIRGTRHADTITGTNAFNRLRGDGGNDSIMGLGGDDRLEGGDGSDGLDGGSGHDLMFGDMGDDSLMGSTGNDTLFGGAGNDSLLGGAGSDDFEGGAGNDTIDGGPAEFDSFDQLNYRNGATTGIQVEFDAAIAFAGLVTNDGLGGQDVFTGINAVNGTAFADTFKGGAGNQRFVGFGGNDTFEGGSGNSEVDYRLEARALGRTAGVTVDLGTGTTVTVKDTSGFTDTLINIKRIRGTDFADRISGNSVDNRLRGDAGNDTLKGAAGNDRLEGGAGTDTAVFSGSRSDYMVTTTESGEVVVTDTRAGGDGTDVVTDMESFQFGQTSVSLAQLLNNGTGVSISGGAVNENSAAGALIGALSVNNRDAASAHTYMLLDDAGGRFKLVDGNKIEVADGGIRLDYEQAKSHKIEVLAIDQFGNGVSQILTISVRNVATEIVTGTEDGNVLVTGAGADKL